VAGRAEPTTTTSVSYAPSYDRAGKDLWISRSRSLLLEAALATRYGNYAMAFERVVRAQAASARLALPLDKEFAEAQQLLLQQRPDVEITLKLMVIADRIEPPAPLGNPDPARKGGVATGEQMGLSSAKSIQPSPHPAPPSPSALPAAATPPVAAPAGASPAAAHRQPPHRQQPPPGRLLLRQHHRPCPSVVRAQRPRWKKVVKRSVRPRSCFCQDAKPRR
jgi:hypothetical protein